MSVVFRLARATARASTVVAGLAARVLRVVAMLLLVLVALLLPAPILGRPRFERPGRRNQPTEVERRR